MAVVALTNAFAYVAGYDFTGDSNDLKLAVEAEQLDATVFGPSGYRSMVGGLKSSALDLAGFWQSATSGSVDTETFPDLGIANRAVTTGADQTETSIVYMGQVGKFSYQPFGKLGELTPFTLAAKGTDPVGVVRGQLAKARGNVSATGVLGSVVNVGAPASGQYVYCTVHVFTAGTTVTLQLQSDTASNFPSPTTQATIGPLTTTGGTWVTRVAGPLAGEAFWRLNVSAITGTFNIAAAVAVQ